MNITLTLTIDQTNLILKGLAELPFKESSSLILTIKNTADEQLAPPKDNEDGNADGR
jgi:hypothetical protein